MTHDYGNNFLAVDQRVELSPACDLWMRGARFGRIVGFKSQPKDHTGQNVSRTVIYKVRMDHPQVRKLQNVPSDMLRPL